MTHAEPSPRLRSASMKFQTAGRNEPQKPACAPTPAPSMLARLARHHDERHVLEVVGEPRGRCTTPDRLGLHLGIVVGRDRHHAVRDVELSPVELRERFLGRAILDEHPLPALLVRTRRRLHRDAHALLDHVVLDGAIEVEALADRTGGGEQLVVGEIERCHWDGLQPFGCSLRVVSRQSMRVQYLRTQVS